MLGRESVLAGGRWLLEPLTGSGRSPGRRVSGQLRRGLGVGSSRIGVREANRLGLGRDGFLTFFRHDRPLRRLTPPVERSQFPYPFQHLNRTDLPPGGRHRPGPGCVRVVFDREYDPAKSSERANDTPGVSLPVTEPVSDVVKSYDSGP